MKSPELKQLEVQILGQSYLLGCPEGGEARMLLAVERVDSAMCAIRDAGKIKARDRIAVLAALNIAFDQAAAPPAPAAPSAPARPVAQSALDPQAQDALLASIVEQLDAALGDDGRLL